MKVKIRDKLYDATFKDGRYYVTFTAQEDMEQVGLVSDCFGDTEFKRIQIEKNPDMTYWVPPEVHEGNISGIFKNLRDFNITLSDTGNEKLWGNIKLNVQGMLEEYHNGTLSAEFIRHAGGIETRLRNEITGAENRMSESVEGVSRLITDPVTGLTTKVNDLNGLYKREMQNLQGEYSKLTQTVKGFETTVGDLNGTYSQWTQTVNGFRQKVTDVEGNYAQMVTDVSGIQTEVEDVKTKTNSRITQLSNSISAKVSSAEFSTLLTQNGSSIMSVIRNNGGDIVNAINQTPQGTQIQADKIFLNASTTYADNFVTKIAKAIKIDASQITSGKIATDRLTAVSVDVKNITGNKGEFIRLGLTALNSRMELTGSGIRISNTQGDFAEMNAIPEFRSQDSAGTATILGKGRVHFYRAGGGGMGFMGSSIETGNRDFGIFMTKGSNNFTINYTNDGTVETEAKYYTVVAGQGWSQIVDSVVRMGVLGTDWHSVDRQLRTLNNIPSGTTPVHHPGQQIKYQEYRTAIPAGSYSKYMLFGLSQDDTRTVYTYTNARFQRDIIVEKGAWIKGKARVGSLQNDSDRRIKRNIESTQVNALEHIRRLAFKQFEMKKDGRFVDIGLIAQESGLLRVHDEIESIDLTKLIYLTTKATQELLTRYEQLAQRVEALERGK